MTVPMMVLAVGSAFLGLLLGPTSIITNWLNPVFGSGSEAGLGAAEEHPVLPALTITVITLVLIAAGLGLAWMRYWRDEVSETAPVGSLITQAARNDLYQDSVNEGVFMRPGIHLTRSLVFADSSGVDGAATGLGRLIAGASGRWRKLQNGYARSYALTMLAGVVLFIGALWVMQ
jgi:NADH-quinone oxidoreductase subunit L